MSEDDFYALAILACSLWIPVAIIFKLAQAA